MRQVALEAAAEAERAEAERAERVLALDVDDAGPEAMERFQQRR